MSMAEDIGTLLQTAGLGTKSVDLFGNTIPGQPPNVVALYDTTGFEPVRTMTGTTMEVRNLQVLVRHETSAGAQAKSELIYTALDRFRGLIGAIYYFSILARTSPSSVGVDENNRRRWSCNYVVHKVRG